MYIYIQIYRERERDVFTYTYICMLDVYTCIYMYIYMYMCIYIYIYMSCMLDVSTKCVCVYLSTYTQTHMYEWSVCVFWLGFTQLPRATQSSKFHFRPSDTISPLFLGPDFRVDPNFSCAQRVFAKSQKTPQNTGKAHNFRKIGRSAHILGRPQAE